MPSGFMVHSLPRAEEGDLLAVRGEAGADLGLRRVGQLLDLEAVGLGELADARDRPESSR